MDEAFAGLAGYRCIVNNVVIYDSNPAQHTAQHTDHVMQFLQWCAEKKITLNTRQVAVCSIRGQLCQVHLISGGLLC